MMKLTKDKILQYEKDFEYTKGIIRTPEKWSRYFWDNYYRKITPFMIEKITGCRRVVFIGIGAGDIVPFLDNEQKSRIIGIDINLNSLMSAAKHTKVILADGSNIPLKSGGIDLVLCNQVLHHIIGQGNLDNTIRECYRILREGGELVAIEPNSLHPSGALMNLANRFHKYHSLTGGSDYEFSISPFSILRILRNNKFSGLKSASVTFSHPRFPVVLQKIINMVDDKFSGLYLAGLINLYSAVK
ncbi:MAG: class I SAM-dependent methyltransferase [Nitrospirota bacterium]